MGSGFFLSSKRALSAAPAFSWGAALSLSLSIASIALIAYFFAGWHYGVQYQGRQFVLLCAWVSAITAVALWVIFGFCRRKHSSFGSLVFYFLLFAWLSTYAFPYFSNGYGPCGGVPLAFFRGRGVDLLCAAESG
jgi:hypothetical protein